MTLEQIKPCEACNHKGLLLYDGIGKLHQIDAVKLADYIKDIRNDLIVPKPTLLCDKAACFNAWLHSTTEEKKGK